jgi:hypothetical protein
MRSRRGPRRRRPGKPHADQGYDSRHLRQWLSRRGIRHRIARKGVETSQRLDRHRWTIERTTSWLTGCRRTPPMLRAQGRALRRPRASRAFPWTSARRTSAAARSARASVISPKAQPNRASHARASSAPGPASVLLVTQEITRHSPHRGAPTLAFVQSADCSDKLRKIRESWGCTSRRPSPRRRKNTLAGLYGRHGPRAAGPPLPGWRTELRHDNAPVAFRGRTSIAYRTQRSVSRCAIHADLHLGLLQLVCGVTCLR